MVSLLLTYSHPLTIEEYIPWVVISVLMMTEAMTISIVRWVGEDLPSVEMISLLGEFDTIFFRGGGDTFFE